jgi:hypothetical protein
MMYHRRISLTSGIAVVLEEIQVPLDMSDKSYAGLGQSLPRSDYT